MNVWPSLIPIVKGGKMLPFLSHGYTVTSVFLLFSDFSFFPGFAIYPGHQLS